MTYEKGAACCVTMIDRLLGDIMQNWFEMNSNKTFRKWFEMKSNKTFRRCRKASKRILDYGNSLKNSKKARSKLHKQNIFLYSIPGQTPNLILI